MPDPDPLRTDLHTPSEPASLGRTSDHAGTPEPIVTDTHAVPAVAIPGYEILGELGRGGMGVVYRARQVTLNREVAIKTILRADAAKSAVARFWAEAEVMAAVKHPNVVQVYELGEHDGRPFMVMELVPGGSLADRVAKGPLPPHQAAELLERVARGVAAAHELGVVHRDLKPGNVLLDDASEPKVSDFGLAKWRSTDLTQTQALMGTPAYMAPEQAAGRAKFVGPQADVWALGVILYECISGARPFEGDTAATVLSAIQSTEPTALRGRVRGLPRDLDTIASKCLAKEPENRYATAAELADDLGRFVRGEPIAARPVGVAERLLRWVRRKPTAAAAYAGSSLAVLLALVVFVVLGFWRDAATARDGEQQARTTAEAARDGEKIARGEAEKARDGEKQARLEVERQQEKLAVFEYGRTMQVAHQESRDNNAGATVALLNGTRKDLRGWEWHYVHRLCHSDLLTLKGHTGNVHSASWSGDGTRIVTGSWDKTAKVWDAKTGADLLTLKGHTAIMYSASWSADCSRIVTGSQDRTAKVWDTKTGAELLTLKGHTAFVNSASFSPDGTRVVTGSSDNTAKVWDAKTGAEPLTLRGHTSGVFSASWSGDGTRIVTGSSDKTAKVLDAKTGAELLTLKGHTMTVCSASFSPDGSRIVTGSGNLAAPGPGEARVWDAKTGAEVLTLKGHAGGVYAASFCGDSTRIVTGSQDETAKVWDAKTGAEVLTLKGHTFVVVAASFSRDGTRIVTGSADKTAKVWDAKTGAEVLTLKGHTHILYSASWSPDGTRIVTGGGGQAAKVWDSRPFRDTRPPDPELAPPRPVP